MYVLLQFKLHVGSVVLDRRVQSCKGFSALNTFITFKGCTLNHCLVVRVWGLGEKSLCLHLHCSLVPTRIQTVDEGMPGLIVYLQDGGEICDELKCSYCKLLMRDPVQTNETGHRLCRECFYAAQKYVCV